MLHDPKAFTRADQLSLVRPYTPLETVLLGLLAVPLTATWLPVAGMAVGVRALGRALAAAHR